MKIILLQDGERGCNRELRAMERLRGLRHVVTLLDQDLRNPIHLHSTADNGEDSSTYAVLVFELVQGGSLVEYMNHVGPFPESLARFYFCDLLRALRTCHREGVYHRDLKPANLLVGEDFSLKVADFGLSGVRVGEPGASTTFYTRCGTEAFAAPEILRGFGTPYSGEKADVWSAGVVLFVMVCGFLPVQQALPGDWWYDRICEKNMGRFWEAHERYFRFSPEFKSLIECILVDNPEHRPTVEEIMEHYWVCFGGIPTYDEVKKEMKRRADTVRAVKERDKLASQMKAATRMAKAAGGGLDVYATDTLRSTEGDTAGSLVPGPEPPTHAYHSHDMYVAGTAEEGVDTVRKALEEMGATVELHAEENDVALSARFDASHIGMQARVFTSESEMVHLVRGIKTGGDLLKYCKRFHDLSTRVHDDLPDERVDEAAGNGELMN